MIRFVFFAFLFFLSFCSANSLVAQNIQSEASKFNWLLRSIDFNYVEQVDVVKTTENAVVKAIKNLDSTAVSDCILKNDYRDISDTTNIFTKAGNMFKNMVAENGLLFAYKVLLMKLETCNVDSVNATSFNESVLVKMLAELDPHSVYISEKEVQEMNEPLIGSFDGIGISFNIFHDTLMVLQTIPGGPSEKVGLAAGDRIIYVDGELIAGKGITNQDVFKKLKGERGTLVKVKILRKGEADLIDFDIIRDKIPLYSLDASYMIDNKTGYIKLSRFSATTTDEFIEALNKLKSNTKFENLILDLRGNGGGYLKAAYEVSDQFLDNAKLVVYTEGLKNPRKDYVATSEGNFEKGKLIVLIDGGSASASEIVSGAVQDWDRGIILGRRSFGKGLVQQPYACPFDKSMIRLTTAHYYTPSGRCIQKPYDDGVEEYQNDFSDRLSSGELFSKDSIQFNDSLLYKTLVNQRDVYGGGGVIPDVFVPMDTSSHYKYYNQLIRKSIVNQYILNYVDVNRKDLSANYPDFAAFKKKYAVSENMLEEIWAEGVKNSIEKDDKAIAFLDKYIRRHLKALVARNLWNIGNYYEIINEGEDEIIKALSLINSPNEYNTILKGKK